MTKKITTISIMSIIPGIRKGNHPKFPTASPPEVLPNEKIISGKTLHVVNFSRENEIKVKK